MRQKIWNVLNGDGGKLSSFYDMAMLIIIIASLVPLVFKTSGTILHMIDHVTVVIFIIDYAARWFTARLKLDKGGGFVYLIPSDTNGDPGSVVHTSFIFNNSQRLQNTQSGQTLQDSEGVPVI